MDSVEWRKKTKMQRFDAENVRVKAIVAQLPTEKEIEAKARFHGLLAKMQLKGM